MPCKVLRKSALALAIFVGACALFYFNYERIFFSLDYTHAQFSALCVAVLGLWFVAFFAGYYLSVKVRKKYAATIAFILLLCATLLLAFTHVRVVFFVSYFIFFTTLVFYVRTALPLKACYIKDKKSLFLILFYIIAAWFFFVIISRSLDFRSGYMLEAILIFCLFLLRIPNRRITAYAINYTAKTKKYFVLFFVLYWGLLSLLFVRWIALSWGILFVCILSVLVGVFFIIPIRSKK